MSLRPAVFTDDAVRCKVVVSLNAAVIPMSAAFIWVTKLLPNTAVVEPVGK